MRHLATLYSRWSLLISGPMGSEGRWASGADVCFRLTSGPCLCLALHAAADGTKVGIDQHALTAELSGARFIFGLGSGIVLPVASEHAAGPEPLCNLPKKNIFFMICDL